MLTDLPASMIEDLLQKVSGALEPLTDSVRDLNDNRDQYRAVLTSENLIRHDSEYVSAGSSPTVCATDGAYVVDRLLASDLVAYASVAVEGLSTPETAHWPHPRHECDAFSIAHSESTGTVVRALMLGHELRLATIAPHQVVMLDGSATVPVIHLNQALKKVSELSNKDDCSVAFRTRACEFIRAYAAILEAQRSDKQYVFIPKYSTKNEIGKLCKWSGSHDDRALLSMLLAPGELTDPQLMDKPREPWHINTDAIRGIDPEIDGIVKGALAGLNKSKVFYYKPDRWLPALRVEVPQSVASNKARLGQVISAIKSQCASPAMLEPYPNYLADRMAKAIATAMPAMKDIACQSMAAAFQGDPSHVFLSLHAFRSEAGRK